MLCFGIKFIGNSLYKAVPTAAATVVLLKLNKLKLSKRLKDGLKVLLIDVEVNVTNIQPVERDGVWMWAGCFGVASLTILLGFCNLDNDGDTEEFLSCELKCLRYRVLTSKLNIANSVMLSVNVICEEMYCRLTPWISG